MLGALLTRWTIRLALACYVAYLGGWLVADSPRWLRWSRWIWTFGCGFFLLHVICAFHFHHHWSHASAWETTARETRDLMGVAFGDGIFFSYVFTALWLADVVWLWLASRRPEGPLPLATGRATSARFRTPWTRLLVHAYLLFIAFNGAIVFEGGPTRWAGIAACLVLAGLAARRLILAWQIAPRAPQQPAALTSDP